MEQENKKTSSDYEDKPIADITLDDIAESGFIEDYLLTSLQQNGIKRLIDLLNYDKIQIFSFRGFGAKKVAKVISLQEEILNAPGKFIEYKKTHNAIIYLPEDSECKNTSLYAQTKIIFQQLVDLLKQKGEDRLSKIIRLFYGVGGYAYSDSQISKNYKLTSEAVRVSRLKFINPFFNGEETEYKIQLSDEFLYEKNNLKNDVIYKDALVFRNKIGFDGNWEEIVNILPLFELDIVNGIENITDQCFLCGINEIGIVKKHVRIIYYILATCITPISYEELYPLLEDGAEKYNIEDIREDIIKKLLIEFKRIETIDGKYQIAYSYLPSEFQKVGRIIYENECISADNILSIYNNRIINESEYKNNTAELRLASLRTQDKRFLPQGKSGIWYFSAESESLKPIKKVIAEYIESKQWIATFDNIKRATQQAGLRYTDSCLRAYISNVCVPSLTDRNLFCHKEHMNEYLMHNWRMPQKYGFSNWIINTVVEILKDALHNSLSFKDVKKQVKDKAGKDGYNTNNIRYVIGAYEGIGNLFTFDKRDNLILNIDVLEVIDLDRIGKIDRTPPYYMELASFIINYLRKREPGIILLREMMKLCDQLIPRGNAIPLYQNLVSKFKELEIIKKSDRLYIQLNNNAEFVAEETHVFAPKEEIGTEPQIIERYPDTTDFVIDTREKQKVTARICFNWESLTEIMTSELRYYCNWMPENITLRDAIDKFKRFMQKDESWTLNKLVPQDIYEYWVCQIDRFDKYHYMDDISKCYEKLLKSIYQENNGHEMNSTGLREAIACYPEFDNALKNGNKFGFTKILSKLWTSRNVISHGNELELSNLKIDMAINEYIALYVYTIAKYVN